MQPLILMHVFIHPPMALSRQHKLLVVSQDLKKKIATWGGWVLAPWTPPGTEQHYILVCCGSSLV